MTLHLGQSSVLPINPYQSNQSIIKKISHYIFRFEDKIGQGNFSKVYKGYHQLTNQIVAIKIIQLSSVKSAKLQQLLFSQIEVIQSLNHPNILKCHQVLKSQNNCYIITQLCDGGDLQTLLKKQKCLDQFYAAQYLNDIFKGLLYLGQRGIVHRDLKIANIFLNKGKCKIADFGFAKYTNNQNFYDLDIGSPLYMSPEGMIDHLYGMKTDIWAFGIIVYELLHGKTPFSFCTSENELKRVVVQQMTVNSLRPDLSYQIKDLILKCLNVNMNNRPDALYLAAHDPYIAKLLNSNTKIQQKVPVLNPNTINNLNPGALYQNNPIIPQQIHQQIPQTLPINQPPSYTNSKPYFKPQQLQKQTTIKLSYEQAFKQKQIIKNPTYSTNNQQKKNGIPSQTIPKNNNQAPLQFNLNSPNRVINSNSKPNSNKQPSVYSYHSKEQANTNNITQHINKQTINQQQHHQYPTKHYYINSNNKKSNNNDHNNNSTSNYLNVTQTYSVSQKKLQYSPSIQAGLQKNKPILNHANKSSNDLFSPDRYNKNTPDHILTPEQLQKRIHSNSIKQINQSFDKISNSSWSHENGAKRGKFPKVLSYENIVTNNNLVTKSNLARKTVQGVAGNVSNITSSTQNLKNLQTSKNSNGSCDFSINQSLQGKKITKPLNFKQQVIGSNKKFGQLIKGQKKPQGSIKSSIKYDKIELFPQKIKTKSQIRYQSNQTLNIEPLQVNKKRGIRHSIGEADINRQTQPQNLARTNQDKNYMHHTERSQNLIKIPNNENISIIPLQKAQYQKPKSIVSSSEKNEVNTNINNNNNKTLITQTVPSFFIKKQKQQIQRNIISTVIQFKQAVGLLHYCRLFFRFITTFKKLLTYPQLYHYQTFKTLTKTQQLYQTLCSYLLCTLNQLIQNIKSKQIIYDGQNYKKKKLKEDKLKQVTEEYYKKYYEEINKNRTEGKRIEVGKNGNNKKITIEYIKPYNQDIWQKLDQLYYKLVQQKKNKHESQSLMNLFRNLCYFSLRMIQANSILYNCIQIKNYSKLGNVLIQNWLAQQYYKQQDYFKYKNQHYKRLAESHIQKGSETNDTEDNNLRYQNI